MGFRLSPDLRHSSLDMAGNDFSEFLMKFLTKHRPAMYVFVSVRFKTENRLRVGFGDGVSHTMPISKVTLCLAPSFLEIWLALVLLSI